MKKRTKKLLLVGARGATGADRKGQKFFASFFQKRRLARGRYALLNRGKGRKRLLFLKKKKQKDVYESALSLSGEAEAKQIKVFWFFSSEKNIALFA